MVPSLDGCMGGSYLLSYQELEEKDFATCCLKANGSYNVFCAILNLVVIQLFPLTRSLKLQIRCSPKTQTYDLNLGTAGELADLWNRR